MQKEDLVFASGDLVDVQWVGVMHTGYELAEGSEAEACLQSAHRRAQGGKELNIFHDGLLGAAIFAVHGNVTALVYGPIAENIHGIDERVSLPSLKRVTKALVMFAA